MRFGGVYYPFNGFSIDIVPIITSIVGIVGEKFQFISIWKIIQQKF